jgi:hypothetical protein
MIWRGFDDDDEVQRLAYGALSGRVDATSIGAVVKRLSTAKPAETRRILQALSRTDSGIVGSLIRLASSSPAKIQLAALKAIAAVGVPTTCPQLLPLLHDSNPHIRRAAAGSVAEIARVAGGVGIHGDVLDGLIGQFRGETDVRVILALIDALEACSGQGALAAVLEKLPTLNSSIRERGLEAITALQRRSGSPRGASTQLETHAH